MAQAVSRWPLTAEARVCARVNPCWICGGKRGTGIDSSPSSSVFPVSIIPPGLHAHMSSGGRTIGPLVAAVSRHSLTASKNVTGRHYIDLFNFKISSDSDRTRDHSDELY
jgi:hypothetical protein